MDRSIVFVIFLSAGLALFAYEARTKGLGFSFTHQSAPSSATRSRKNEQPPSKSCLAQDLQLQWPVAGVDGKDYLIANYLDLDPTVGKTLDYMGATGADAVTYDGHTGVDMELASFRVADAGVPAFAAADGVVEEVYDDSVDRNMTCSSDKWNYVKIRHANGFASIYAHLQKNSALVAPRAKVTAGTRLGLIGSSGCSSYPHLHFEVVDCFERPVDVMKQNMFISAPPYARTQPGTVMETTVFQPPINAILSIQDPGSSDVGIVSVGSMFSFGLTLSYLHRGDTVSIEFYSPMNSKANFGYSQVSDRNYLRSHWWSDFRFDQPGTWTANVKINGQTKFTRSITAQ